MPNRLRAGFSGIRPEDYGKGPGGNTTPPIWQSTVRAIEPNNILTTFAQAELYDFTVFAVISGSREGWCDLINGKLIYNNDKYRQKLDRWTVEGGASQAVADCLTAALLSRRFIAYVVDEPFIDVFDGSIPKSVQNNMGLMHKARWDCITAIRSPYRFMKPPPTGGWTGIDYGWAQLDIPDHEVHSGLTPREFWAEEKAEFLAMDLGMIPGANWLNSGDTRLWDHDNNPATANRRVQGAGGEIPGRVQGSESTTNRKWLCPPDHIREMADAIYDDPDAPGFNMYHDANAAFINDIWLPYQLRSDFVAAFDYMINKFNTRPVWNGWRTAKGTTPPPPPPPPSSGENAFAFVTARETMTSDTYAGVPGAEILAADLVAGRSYLLLVSAQLDYSIANFNSYAQFVHGSTTFPRSEVSWQRPDTGKRYNYFFWTVWTAVASENIQLQVRNETGRSDTVGADQVVIVAVDLSGLPANSVHYNEDVTSDALNTTYLDGASTTFTPTDAGTDWLLLTHARYITPDTSDDLFSRMNLAGATAATDPIVTVEGADAVLDMPLLHTARVETLAASAHTLKEQSKNGGTGGPRVGSAVLALNLNAFSAHAAVFDDAALTLNEGTPKFGTLLQSVPITLTANADVLVLGFTVFVPGTTGVGIRARLQVNNADSPSTQTTDEYVQQMSWDTTDSLPVMLVTALNLGLATHTMDFDASATSASTTPAAWSRMLVALQLSAPPPAGNAPVWDLLQDQTVNEGETLSFTVSASDTEDLEADLSYTVVSELPENAQFDSTTRTFNWTPSNDQAGVYPITLRVADTDGDTTDITFNITVVDVPTPVDFKNLRNLRYDHSLQGGRLDIVVTWNGAGDADKRQGITGIEVKYTDTGRI